MISDQDVEAVAHRAASLPPATGVYHDDNFVHALLATVVDYQMNTTAVVKALEHFKSHHGDVSAMSKLQDLLRRYPDDREGNTALALDLWGYRLWTRAEQLRRLVDFFDALDVQDLDALRQWAAQASFKKDFEGKVRGLGPAVYQWLVMRQGVETVKPDVHVHRFVREAIGRAVSDNEAVEAVQRAAEKLGTRAHLLDWAIWEWSRSQ